MATYLIKFSACLAIFWLFYILFLERQNMHRFKRFYLLGALVLALVIPTLKITEYIEPIATTFETAPVFIPMESFTEIPVETPSFWNLENVLWLVYGLGVLLLLARFLINLLKMNRRISKNETIAKQHFTYVLLKENLIPHSFFKYLFFNKIRYESQNIPEEVILHEETHAKQLHSLDIIILELLQIVFWFHPLIYILKHHVKLNHEFLADQAVLNHGADAKTYQNILLQFSSSDNYQETEAYRLSSTINYSSIKKRFTVMKTQTSKTRIWLSTFLVLPIIALLFYSFAEKEYVEKPIVLTSEILETKNEASQKEMYDTVIQENRTKILKTNKNKSIILLEHWYITINNNKFYYPYKKGDLKKYYDKNGNEVDLDIVKEYVIKYETFEALKRIGKHYVYKSNKEQEEIDALFSDLGGIYFRMSKENKSKVKRPISPIKPYVQITLNGNTYYKKRNELTLDEIATFPPPPEHAIQQKATAKQVAAYNTWAKELKTTESKIIMKKDLDKYQHIYSIMTAEQKKTAEAFPKIPPPPPPTEASPNKNGKKKTLNEIIQDTPKGMTSGFEMLDNGESHYFTEYKGKKTYYNKDGFITDEKGKISPPPPPTLKSNQKTKTKEKGGPNVSQLDQSKSNPSFLEFIIEMEEKGATFYYHDKKISAEEAKTLARTNTGKSHDMITQKDANDRYIVKLSKTKYEIKTEDGETLSMTVNDCLEVPSTLKVNSVLNKLNINCIEDYPNNTIEIYNRFGKIIYSKKGYDNSWKGTDENGKLLVEGKYYYSLDIGSKNGKPQVGYITIIK
ncbi:MAG: gliding motility-associated C-terminal domain-containing protein [Winogradskyella sp.]|uniref:T9SS type B sorting domain-containing protein n=1 Tax=Winogradskyella sp. TaxID=1883156 RepID=UPI00385F8485